MAIIPVANYTMEFLVYRNRSRSDRRNTDWVIHFQNNRGLSVSPFSRPPGMHRPQIFGYRLYRAIWGKMYVGQTTQIRKLRRMKREQYCLKLFLILFNITHITEYISETIQKLNVRSNNSTKNEFYILSLKTFIVTLTYSQAVKFYAHTYKK